ncbi:MAG: OPT/YSL family transporter, partial [Phycisphaerales bacterium]
MDDQPHAAPPTEPAAPARTPKSYREVTVSAVVFALVIGVVMNAAITYAGLKIGFTIGGSAIAAVLGFGVLRGVLRRGSILETNIAQTAASAINTSNSGVIFTVPVLLLLGVPLVATGKEFWLITLACMAGAALGAVFIIPLRKQMIDIDRLRFPTGTGVAVILKSPGAGAKKSLVLLAGIVIAAVIYLPVGLPQLTSPAKVEDLPKLFEQERISWGDVELTREIASWIEQERAPESVVARGEALSHLAELRWELAKSKTDAERVALQDQIQELDRRIHGELSGDAGISNGLAEAAYEASTETDPGKRTKAWASLRNTDLGWAADPMFGYADLGIRLKAVVDETKPARDQNGDGVPEPVLAHHVDLDQNGRPDLAVTDEHVDAGRLLGLPPHFQLIFAIAPFALGAGYITGRPGLLVLAGGILAYFVITPFAYSAGWMPETTLPGGAPGYGFSAFNRPLGIGLLLGGAMMGVLASLPAIREALKSVATVGRAAVSSGGRDELGLKPLLVASIAAVALLYLAADFVTNRPLNNDVAPISGQPVSAEVGTATYHGYVIAF